MSRSALKVLHLIGGDLGGGAARGAYSLHRALLANGIHSRVLTDSNSTLSDHTVLSIATNHKGKLARAFRRQVESAPVLLYPHRANYIFSPGLCGFDFRETEAYAEATIIHLHWINGGFVSPRHLHNIDKRIVWTLRDMWPMTGGCHYSMGCENFLSSCGMCPQLGSTSRFDLSRIVNKFKQRRIPKSIKVVGISEWLSGLARDSSIFKGFDVRTISNNIDTQEFFPLAKPIARSLLGIHTEKKLVLVGAQSIHDFYKGFHKFLAALHHLDTNRYHLCFFGRIGQDALADLGFSVTSLGYLHDAIALRLAYSAADVFVAPSVMDAFGKTLAEAMACGTPVVCFDSTGPRDIVDHMINGYRASPFDAEDLASGIRWVCDNDNTAELVRSARDKVTSSFDCMIVAKHYIQLYEEQLSDHIDA